MKTFVIIARTEESKSGMTEMEMAEAVIRNAAIKQMSEAAKNLKEVGADIDVAVLEDTDAEAVVGGWQLKKQGCRYDLDKEPEVHMV